jgi:TadE-like protein
MRKTVGGMAMLETLIAVPVVLFLGLAAVQWGLVFHGRYAVAFALQEAARAGATGFADVDAIEKGLARGLVPYLYGANGYGVYQANRLRAVAHVQAAQLAGFARLRMLSPTNESFADWAKPARDAQGDLMSGVTEILNDNLSGLAARQTPATQAAADRLGYKIGASSGQSLSDANILKLELTYGIPLTVPIVGRLTAQVMKALDQCGSGSASFSIAVPRPWACAFYTSVNERGEAIARLPIVVSAQARMQTPARRSGQTGGLLSAALQTTPNGNAYGLGDVDQAQAFRSPTWVNQPPAPLANSNLPPPPAYGQSGFLQFGADRAISVPVPCI